MYDKEINGVGLMLIITKHSGIAKKLGNSFYKIAKSEWNFESREIYSN